jgi:hypothetical protein
MRNEFFTKLQGQNIGDPVREKYREGKVSILSVLWHHRLDFRLTTLP